MRKIKKKDKKIIAIGLIGIIVLVGVFFVVYPGAFVPNGGNGGVPPPPSSPYLNYIHPLWDYDGTIQMNWIASTSATSYKVYRSKDGSAFSCIKTGVTGTGYTDFDLSSGTYVYKLKATNAGGDSGYSNTQTVYMTVPNKVPTATIDSVTPNPAEQGVTITFKGSGTDTDGTISVYRWFLSDFTILSSSATFTKSASDFDVGTIMIGFWVKDDDGAWSSVVTVDLTINEYVNKKPTATITSISPNPAIQGVDTISFSGSGSDSDGTITVYEWSSSISGFLSNSKDFSKSTNVLSIGQHTIYFRVKDNDGAWSSKVSKVLTIEEVVISKPDAPILYDISPSIDTDGTIRLSWSVDENADSYKVYRDGLYIRSGLTINSYTDRDLSDGTYTYTITAVNEGGESDHSNEEVVTVDTSGELPEIPEDLTGIIVIFIIIVTGCVVVIYFVRRLKRKLVS